MRSHAGLILHGAFRVTPFTVASLFALLVIGSGRVNAAAEPATQPAIPPATPRAPVAAETLAGWFDDLAASDAAVRDKAFSALLFLHRHDLGTLRAVVEKGRPVAPSQAAVLHDVVTHVYLTGETYDADPRAGFLGLLFPLVESVEVPGADANPKANADANDIDPAPTRRGVPIENRLPGFCAFRMFRDGDVVLGIVDPMPRRLRDWSELSLTVQTFRGGQTITFEVLRRGQLLEVPIQLDARPVNPNERTWADDIIPSREAAAEEYWNERFLPLVEDRISLATP